jgi:serine phosphatase RsbU (regulator of sigma subunit)
MDLERKLFGQQRLEQAMAQARQGADAVGAGVLAALRRHKLGCPQSDDITLLCFGRE